MAVLALVMKMSWSWKALTKRTKVCKPQTIHLLLKIKVTSQHNLNLFSFLHFQEIQRETVVWVRGNVNLIVLLFHENSTSVSQISQTVRLTFVSGCVRFLKMYVFSDFSKCMSHISLLRSAGCGKKFWSLFRRQATELAQSKWKIKKLEGE